ncbi:MAG: F-box protein [Alphaproteobacteria bacterium]|nr:F-box protein [Alphaproteobacteria bacterium]
MKKIIILFILILLPFKLCLASYKEQFFLDDHVPYKRLRFEVEDLSGLSPDQWNTLSYEVWFTIFDYLNFKELKAAQLVCKHRATVTKDETLSMEYHFLKRSYTFTKKNRSKPQGTRTRKRSNK